VAGRRQSCNVDRDPRVDHPDGRCVHREIGRLKGLLELGAVERSAFDAEPRRKLARRLGRSVADRHPPRAGADAGVDDRVRGSARPRDHDARTRERPAHRQLDAARNPGASLLNPTSRPVVGPDDVVHRADRLRVWLDLVDETRDDLLVRRRNAQPQEIRPAGGATKPATSSGSSSASS
jgi:hypothetical protein